MSCSSSLIELSSTELACNSIIKWLTIFIWWIEIRCSTTSWLFITYRPNSLSKLHTLQFPFGDFLLSTRLLGSISWFLFSNAPSWWFWLIIIYFSSKSFIHSLSTCIRRFPLLFHIKCFSLLLEYLHTYLWMFLVCFFIKLPLACWALNEIRRTTTHWWICILWWLLGLITRC